MAVKLWHCNREVPHIHKESLWRANCRTTSEKKDLQRISSFHEVFFYEFYCPGCDQTLYAWKGINYQGKETSLAKIRGEGEMKIWDAWIRDKDLVDPSGVDSVQASKKIFPFTIHNVPVMT